MKTKHIPLLILLIAVISCKKSDPGVANLTVSAVAASDSSGKVNFIATAENATSFRFDFGDGSSQDAPGGNISHQYTSGGTNTYTATVTASGAGGSSLSKSISVTVIVKPRIPQLVFSDEFDTPGIPDPAKWGYDIGGNGWGNNELEYYTDRPENVIVKDGNLVITALAEKYMGNNYTSARILSQGKYEFTYGKVEARAKLPSVVGTWPAIWMLGSNISTVSWPACGEIDIMEHLGRDLNRIYSTLHYPGRSGGNANGSSLVISDAATQFHIYSLEWNKSIIRMAVDGAVVHTVGNSGSIPFSHDFFLIMNVAMGGNFAGSISPSFIKDSMVVDYIRVYQ